MKPSHITKFFVILLLCASALTQDSDPPQTALELNNLLNLTNIESGYTYYTVNF